MECPKCKSRNYVKDGIVKKKQRYLCKECKYRYTVEQRGIPNATKTLAIQMYLEGLGFRSIERILKVSNVSVLNWVKALGKQVEEYRKPVKNIEIIELDELHTYIQSKKTIVGSGLLLIGLDVNSSISCLVAGGQKQE
jgi:transposase-like protein